MWRNGARVAIFSTTGAQKKRRRVLRAQIDGLNTLLQTAPDHVLSGGLCV
jgi:hypothetical protein